FLPGGPEGAGRDDKQVIQCSTGLKRETALHLAIDPVCDYRTSMMGCAIECPKGRQFKAAADQFFESHIDQISQVVFGARSLNHRAEKRFASRWTVGFQVQRLPDEG